MISGWFMVVSVAGLLNIVGPYTTEQGCLAAVEHQRAVAAAKQDLGGVPERAGLCIHGSQPK